MASDVIRRQKLYEAVEARLVEDILEGRLKVGDALPPERELMQRFGVGRPAVREALFSLQKKGLVTVGNGERTRVCAPDPTALLGDLSVAVRHYLSRPDGLKALHDLRMFLETGLAREAARRASDSDIARLERALLANKASIGDKAAFESTDNAFHMTLAEITGNPLFVQVHAAVIQWLADQRTVALEHPEVEESSYAMHERIFRAIAKRSPDQAENAVRASLDNVDALYRAAYTRQAAALRQGTGPAPAHERR